MSNTVDARGLACPQPVIMTKMALDAELSISSLIIDNPARMSAVWRKARDARSRCRRKAGWNLYLYFFRRLRKSKKLLRTRPA